MNLKKFFETASQADMARALGVTPGAVNQWISGQTALSAERCLLIEEYTQGKVTCEDLRPDVRWDVIRGRSSAQPDAQAM